MNAVIVGAGIGGLTAALALARQGAAVTVCERAAELGEVGAGIQLSPNAMRVMARLGLASALDAVACRPLAVESRGWRRGQLVSRSPLGAEVEAAFGFPYLHVHRADLMAILADAVRAEPLIELRLGTACAQVEMAGQPAIITADGERIAGTIVIGADGIHSEVRRALFGAETPRFTGNVAWRGVIPAAALTVEVPRVAGLWMGPGAHFVHYFVRGGALLNFVAVVETASWNDESWTARGAKAQLRADFAGWHAVVRSIINASPEDGCFRWALFDRDPLPAWGRDRVTLLGDACHPTLPFMAQGACMAIEDAAVLAACVGAARNGDMADALRRYEDLRHQRTASVQLGSRANSRTFHLRPPLSNLRNRAMRKASGLQPQMRDLYSYDAFAAVSAPVPK